MWQTIGIQWPTRLLSIAGASALPLLLLIGLSGNAAPQARPSIDGQLPEPYRIAVNVDLVVLPATVRDRNGQFVSDLREQDFTVYEDGVPQSLQLFRHEDVPVTVGVVVDHSSSMRPKISQVIAGARAFVRSSSPQDEMFVVNFNEHVTLGLPAAIRFTDSPDELARAISITSPGGETALYDAVVEALGRLETGSRDKKALLVISDGGDNASAHSLSEVLKMAGQSSVVIYAIGIFDQADPDRNPGVLERLAHTTGGEAFFPAKLDEVVAVCQRVARDIRHQYTLGYVPGNAAQPGTSRTIRVSARAAGKGKLSVRTRSSYIAGGANHSVKVEGAK